MKDISKSKGFTLIELLVVISIVALLASVVLSSVNEARKRANDQALVQDAKSLQDAVELYRTDNGSYPFEAAGQNCYPDGTSNSNVCYLGSDASGSTLQYGGPGNKGISTSIVPKYISIFPHAPTWPNNGTNYFIGYYTYPTAFENDRGFVPYYCGQQPFTKYIIYFYDNNRTLNFPHFESGLVGGQTTAGFWDVTTQVWHATGNLNYAGGTYCLSM